MTRVFDSVGVIPSYYDGGVVTWAVSVGFTEPRPWTFRVEQSETPEGPWTPAGTYGDAVRGAAIPPTRTSKSMTLFFRVVLIPAGYTPTEYASDAASPYGTLGRADYILALEIMRREQLRMRMGAGVDVVLWSVSERGSACTVCRDPVTGDVTASDCPDCLGTGRVPPYFGPFQTFAEFSNSEASTVNGQAGTVQPADLSARLLCAIPLKRGDIIVKTAADKRYFVETSARVAEIRTTPVVQMCKVSEIINSDPTYRIGSAEGS